MAAWMFEKLADFFHQRSNVQRNPGCSKKRDPYFMARSNRLSTWVVVHTLYAANHQGSSGQYAGMCWGSTWRIIPVDVSG